jgi:hypothetical protein
MTLNSALVGRPFGLSSLEHLPGPHFGVGYKIFFTSCKWDGSLNQKNNSEHLKCPYCMIRESTSAHFKSSEIFLWLSAFQMLVFRIPCIHMQGIGASQRGKNRY